MGAQTDSARGPACGYVGRTVLQICCCLQMIMPRKCRDRIMGPSPVIDETEFEGDYDVEVTRNAPSPTDVNPLLGPHVPSSTDGPKCRGHRTVAHDREATATATAAAAAVDVPAYRPPASPPMGVHGRGVGGAGDTQNDGGVGSGRGSENDEQQQQPPPPSPSSAQVTVAPWAKRAVSDLWEAGRPGASHEPECVICMDPFTKENPEMRTLCSCGENQPGCRFHYPCLLLYVERKGEKCPTCGGSLYWEEASC